MGLFKIFLDFYDIKTRLDHLEAFGTFTYARNASGAQRCKYFEILMLCRFYFKNLKLVLLDRKIE